MTDRSAGATRRPRRRRVLAWTAGVSAFLVLLFYLGGGWYFSNVLDDRALDGASRRASTEPAYDLEIVRVTEGSVELAPTGDAPEALAQDGVFGLRWDGGYGQVEAVLAVGTPPAGGGAGAVERSFTLLDGSMPEPGAPAQLDVRAFPTGPADAGLDVRDVVVPGPLGTYPAWFVDGREDTWAVVVHGNSMSRLDCVRILPILAEAGLPTLTITYRNDAGAPEDPSGKLRYGLTEWEDLEAAVAYALDEGAENVVLVGFSMGGSVVAAFLQRSDLRDRVPAVVLDAPMLDFSATVDDNASREELPLVGVGVPSSLTAVAKWMASWRFGVEWDQMDYLAGAAEFTVPFLVLHGTQDTTVPIATSERFTELRPDLVDLVSCRGAEHIECWNLDPDGYGQDVLGFLRQTVGSQG